jgi:hypothetical protein
MTPICDSRAKLGEGAEVVFSLGALCFLPERTPATDRLGEAPSPLVRFLNAVLTAFSAREP